MTLKNNHQPMAAQDRIKLTVKERVHLHHPIDYAIHRLAARRGSVVDFHNVYYRVLVGKKMADKFLIVDDQLWFERALKIADLIKERNESQIPDPRVNVWYLSELETCEMLDVHRLVIDMHDVIHRKHFLSTYKAVNDITIAMLHDFEKRFPPKRGGKPMQVIREGATA